MNTCRQGIIAKYYEAILRPFQRGTDTIAFWRSDATGKPANGGNSTMATVGLTEEINGPLKLCTKNALHGTLAPEKWKGERCWIVALHEPVQKIDDKAGSLKRTFLADLGKCSFN